jgi:predicted pyridoxine 5'-phosphate oxidase superfamily flavin-nucleotide-binding protein
LIPGNGDTLRVSGKGRIVRDSSLQARLAIDGKLPNLVLVVTVEQAFVHCPKCVVRSRLWTPGQWPDRSNVPSLAEAIVAHAKPAETAAEVRAIIDDHNAHLY